MMFNEPNVIFLQISNQFVHWFSLDFLILLIRFSFRQLDVPKNWNPMTISKKSHFDIIQEIMSRSMSILSNNLSKTTRASTWLLTQVFHFSKKFRCLQKIILFTQFFARFLSIISKVIIEKSRDGRFLWNRSWDFG